MKKKEEQEEAEQVGLNSVFSMWGRKGARPMAVLRDTCYHGKVEVLGGKPQRTLNTSHKCSTVYHKVFRYTK
jgi:hypothetical protein